MQRRQPEVIRDLSCAYLGNEKSLATMLSWVLNISRNHMVYKDKYIFPIGIRDDQIVFDSGAVHRAAAAVYLSHGRNRRGPQNAAVLITQNADLPLR